MLLIEYKNDGKSINKIIDNSGYLIRFGYWLI